MTLLDAVFQRLEALDSPAFIEFILVGVEPRLPRMLAPRAIYTAGTFAYVQARRPIPVSGGRGGQLGAPAQLQGDFAQQFSTASFARPTSADPEARQNFDTAQEELVKMELSQSPATLTIHYLSAPDVDVALTELLTDGSDGVMTGIGDGILYTLAFGDLF